MYLSVASISSNDTCNTADTIHKRQDRSCLPTQSSHTTMLLQSNDKVSNSPSVAIDIKCKHQDFLSRLSPSLTKTFRILNKDQISSIICNAKKPYYHKVDGFDLINGQSFSATRDWIPRDVHETPRFRGHLRQSQTHSLKTSQNLTKNRNRESWPITFFNKPLRNWS